MYQLSLYLSWLQHKFCLTSNDLGDNCIQNFHLGRYIVGYTVRNSVLRRRVSGAVKRDFRTYIWRYTPPPNENFEYRYPHSNAPLTFSLQKDSENVLCCAYRPSYPSCINRLPAAYIHLSTNEKRCYVMTSGFQQYIAGYTVAILWRYPIRRRVAFARALDLRTNTM